MFDKIKFFKAAALLKSFKSNLPKGDEIELNHVEDYHSCLLQLEEQVNVKLTEFRIPASAIKSKEVLTGLSQGRAGEWHGSTRTEEYCDPDVFRRQLDAVILFIDAYLPGLQSNQK
jgi:hypothetical protein